MRYLSPLISDARGKLGGTVYSRNPQGPYTRAKTAPLQPRTVSQQAGRAVFASAARFWRTLGPETIAAWNAYAATQTHVDSLGRRSRPSGFTCFVARWRNLYLVGRGTVPVINDGPPDWREIPIVGGAANLLAGTLTSLQLILNAPNGAVFDQVILSATPPLSPGTTFLARQAFRVLPQLWTYFGGVLECTAAYLAVHPSPTAGQGIGLRVRRVDPDSGNSGLPTLIRLTAE
jgi:hypothetical protein